MANSIPEDWIKNYVDLMLTVAAKFDDGPMREAALRRADYAMDLVKAYRAAQQEAQPKLARESKQRALQAAETLKSMGRKKT